MIDGDDDTFPDALRALVKRLLLEEKAAELAPAERKPVAGWEKSGGVSCLAAGSLRAKVALENWVIVAECDGGLASTDADAQLAAEDALWGIADAINALRGRK